MHWVVKSDTFAGHADLVYSGVPVLEWKVIPKVGCARRETAYLAIASFEGGGEARECVYSR